MAKLAPVAPIQVLEGLYAAGPQVFGDYHLLLAHHTVEHGKRFKELFARISEDTRNCKGPGKDGINNITVIMDNSIVELGGAVDDDMIREAVELIDFPFIDVIPVLPDVMGQGEETRHLSAEAYGRWEADNMPGVGYCAVCQGDSIGDFQKSLSFFGNKETFPLVEMLSIPRYLHKTVGSRVRPAVDARPYFDTHKIHFLGFCDDVTDDIDSVSIIPGACIDSAVPLRVREEFTEFTDAGKRPADWFETAQVDKRMLQNLENARRMFRFDGHNAD